jgi:hypothetical protein
MAEPTTVTSDELREAGAIRQMFAELTAQYGKLGFAGRTLEREKTAVETRFDELAKREIVLMTDLQKKYGVGTLNVETGEFTPESE